MIGTDWEDWRQKVLYILQLLRNLGFVINSTKSQLTQPAVPLPWDCSTQVNREPEPEPGDDHLQRGVQAGGPGAESHDCSTHGQSQNQKDWVGTLLSCPNESKLDELDKLIRKGVK